MHLLYKHTPVVASIMYKHAAEVEYPNKMGVLR